MAIANASFQPEKRNPGLTEIVEILNRGYALTIDSGWRGVANTALAFIRRFVYLTPVQLAGRSVLRGRMRLREP